MIRPRLRTTFFPYTTLFRSQPAMPAGEGGVPAERDLVAVRGHDAARQLGGAPSSAASRSSCGRKWSSRRRRSTSDRKSTRLNSSHVEISYAVFCLKKKNIQT